LNGQVQLCQFAKGHLIKHRGLLATAMSTISRPYRQHEQYYNSNPRSRPPSPTPSNTSQSDTMSNASQDDCRACQLGIFCYDHTSTSTTPTPASPPSRTQEPNQTPNSEAPVPEQRSSSSDEGLFERSNIGDEEDHRLKTPPTRSVRNPSLPIVQVNGIEIPYWETPK
jgi:hypothetical protein